MANYLPNPIQESGTREEEFIYSLNLPPKFYQVITQYSKQSKE
jgi:hypothetical protein